MHPGIADPLPGLQLRASPHFAVPDGQWNHGEGFGVNDLNDEDRGGWFGNDDGTGLESTDIHTPESEDWGNLLTWSSPFYNSGASVQFRRLEGYLRPAGLALPLVHPLYGNVSSVLPQGYVDQGAFEMFTPTTSRSPGQKILICVLTHETRGFPADRHRRNLAWHQVYMGFFSPDGLERREQPLPPSTLPPPPRTPQDFANNNDDSIAVAGVRRPDVLQVLASWSPTMPYWPILAYVVPSATRRPTTLNEQRYLQIAQAAKLLLQESTGRNPLWPLAALTPAQVNTDCVVCFIGNSNGGMNAQLAPLRFPNLVHGCYAAVIHPAYQRLYGEHDLVTALARFSGERADTGLSSHDFMDWDQYAWSQGLEMHDLSYLRRFVAGTTHRPAVFGVGDEDVTSTGTDWVRVLDGVQWRDHGIAPGPQGQNYVAHTVFAAACAQRDAELSGQVPPPPAYPIAHQPRSGAQSLRGLDDPHEWFFGRLGNPLPPAPIPNTAYERDDTFFAPMAVGTTAQAGATGTAPGVKEAMLVFGQRVYVGSVDGIVTAFAVDQNHAKRPLVAVARSPRLGHDVSALAVLGAGSNTRIVVGSRRHLHLLRLDLTVVTSVEFPWELARPHHLRVADVLPNHTGPEILFASMHGGLAFYDQNLAFVHEWTEPGIVDFAVSGGVLTILSARGVLANVTFSGPQHTPTLVGATEGYPSNFATASQGSGLDLELMWLDHGPVGQPLAVVSLWQGDFDGHNGSGSAIRAHRQDTFLRLLFSNNERNWQDLAVCAQSASYWSGSDIGDHLLALGGDTVMLFNQLGVKIGEKNLTRTTQGASLQGEYWPFGVGAHTMAVGDLVSASTDYSDEVVFATNHGLMWMHIDDIVGTTETRLPASGLANGGYAGGYWMEVARAGFSGTGVQPRTNQTLSGAWAMARLPNPSLPGGFDDKLHVLDMRGNYWRVGHSGALELWDRFEGAKGARGWAYCGRVTGRGAGFVLPFDQTYLATVPGPTSSLVGTTPWFTKSEFAGDVVYQNATPPVVIPDAWIRLASLRTEVGGFLPFHLGGSVLPVIGGGCEAWMWAAGSDWGNLLEGMQINSNGLVAATWSSVQEPDPTTVNANNTIGAGCNHLWLRSFTAGNTAMSQQAIQAMQIPNGPRVLVLGCPGGRVRIVQPGTWRTSETIAQGAGSVLASSADLGFGGGSLAVREVAGSLQIWFGTIEHPAARPSSYDDATSSLQAGEEVSAAIHSLTWSPGQPAVVASAAPVLLHPTTIGDRGAYGVVGMKYADLDPQSSGGDSLLVATISGDLLIYDVATSGSLSFRGRTHVPGAIGCNNAIAVEDLDRDGYAEIYVAGSLGLWRFVHTSEGIGL